MAGEFDTLALRRRVEQWRAEAERVPDRHMRAFCLREVQFPIEAGRVFRGESGQRSDLMAATIPN